MLQSKLSDSKYHKIDNVWEERIDNNYHSFLKSTAFQAIIYVKLKKAELHLANRNSTWLVGTPMLTPSIYIIVNI